MSEQHYTAKIEVGDIVIYNGVRYQIDKIAGGYIVASSLIGRSASTEVIDPPKRTGVGIYTPENKNGHCWHHADLPDGGQSDLYFVCCHCGHTEWVKRQRVPPMGHGLYHPRMRATGKWLFNGNDQECRPQETDYPLFAIGSTARYYKEGE